MNDNEDAFVETEIEEPSPSTQQTRVTLRIAADGRIDWSAIADDKLSALVEAITQDPQAAQILGVSNPQGEPEIEVVADSTVLAVVNVIMLAQAIVTSTAGQRIVPVLKNIPPAVAIKACMVSSEEVEPILAPSKRLVAKYVPETWLQHQDWGVVVEHLGKLSAARFQECIRLAGEIERMKKARPVTPGNANGGVKEQSGMEGAA